MKNENCIGESDIENLIASLRTAGHVDAFNKMTKLHDFFIGKNEAIMTHFGQDAVDLLSEATIALRVSRLSQAGQIQTYKDTNERLAREIDGVIANFANVNGADVCSLSKLEKISNFLSENENNQERLYEILMYPCASYEAMVFAVCADGPQNYMRQIAKELRKRGISGTVVFDLLAANASKNRRYFSIGFNGKDFDGVRFNLQPLSDDLKQTSSQYFLENYEKFNFSLLSKDLIKNGDIF